MNQILTRELYKQVKHYDRARMEAFLQRLVANGYNAGVAALNKKVVECIEKGILEDFLRANRAEVEAVSVYEFDEKLHEDTIKEIAYSEGYAKGEESGFARGEESGYAKGEESGFAKGEKSGYINGEIYGRVKAYHELNVSITEIASKVGISVDKVTEILNK